MQVTTEAALGLIGGTMGLLTGFSILSGVEIIYYMLRLSGYSFLKCFENIKVLFRFFMSLRVPRAQLVNGTI